MYLLYNIFYKIFKIFYITLSNSTSPTIFFLSTPSIPALTPASKIIAPYLIQSPLIKCLQPAAEITKSDYNIIIIKKNIFKIFFKL